MSRGFLNHRIIGRREELRPSDILDAIKAPDTSIVHFLPRWRRGCPNEYHSEADYWWPKDGDEDSFQRRDGESNPNIFSAHRHALRALKYRVSLLVLAAVDLEVELALEALIRQLHSFFINPATRMLPNLRFAQGIPNRCKGRAAGLIDGLHFAEIAISLRKVATLIPSNAVVQACCDWFRQYYAFLTNTDWGNIEANRENNHATAYWLQRACVALFINERESIDQAKRWIRDKLLPQQMDLNGSFPAELLRTKPYGYSLFQVNCLALLHQALHLGGDDSIWKLSLSDGRSVRRAVEWIWPFIKEPEDWPFDQDVEHFSAWKVRHPALLFAGLIYDNEQYLERFYHSPSLIENDEVDRNSPALCLPNWI